MKVDHTGKALDYGFTVEVKCQCRAGLCPKPPSTFGEGHVCSKPAGHDDYDGLHHTCANCGKDFNSLSVVPWAYKSMEDEDRAKLIRQRLETPNAKSQATDAALSRQVACTDGLGVAVPPAPTIDEEIGNG